MSDSSRDPKSKRESTTCANCAQKIVPFGEYSWAHVLGNLMCSLSARPVAELASTGEPPRYCANCKGNEIYHNNGKCIHTDRCECKQFVPGPARPSEPSAPQVVSVCNEHLIRDPNCSSCNVTVRPEQATYPAAPQPVSGDAPKVEEIAREIVRKFADKYGNVGVSHQNIDMVSHVLRPYFPPASTAWKSPDSHLGAVRD